MQLAGTTSAAAMSSNSSVRVLVSNCDIAILVACSVAAAEILQEAPDVEYPKGSGDR
jgi:hypothetical protein